MPHNPYTCPKASTPSTKSKANYLTSGGKKSDQNQLGCGGGNPGKHNEVEAEMIVNTCSIALLAGEKS